MRIRDYGEMNLQDLDVMREIGSIGTGHAATSLSNMLQKEVRITFPQIKILGYDEAVDSIGGDVEEVVGATLVKMDGEINGLMLFLFNLEFANTIFEKMMGVSYPSFEAFDDMAHSAITEIGNIIICSYVNAFTELVDLNISLSVPSSAVSMLGAILTVPIAEYGYETDKLMYCTADFVIEGKTYNDWLLMLPDIASLNNILKKLGVE
ncbi:chemotaxis protein CheC [Oribacterium sp. KHPX15]|uniref:chemotaxis protein CheC n=1 Tax=unclassified Oribacterium TaxID=2629782 RepID=UPI0004E12044|nr:MULTISPECIES: chemotaxis protein CheC [unclassified Oribacterium]SEA42579.1 chemotaxis protein CheC [Oribacterium sp. KHPX15]